MTFSPGFSFRVPETLPPMTAAEHDIVRRFTELVWQRWTHERPGGEGPLSIGWCGHLAFKSPLDLWTYQEIIVATQPDVIIECGTFMGGSGLFLAHLCEVLGTGRVVSIDVTPQPGRPNHALLDYVTGSSADPQIVAAVRARVREGERVMVILDSDHTAAHVGAELDAYADLVSPGCYLVVEDTVISGNPLLPDFGPGPMDAATAFLARRRDFEVDRSRERFLFTLNPSGYLRRV